MAVAFASEDDCLPLVRGCFFASAQCPGRHPVGEDGDVARDLHALVMRRAAEDSKAVLLPALEFGLVRRAGIKDDRCRVEDERRIWREAREILVATMRAERLDETLGGGQDLVAIGRGGRGQPPQAFDCRRASSQ